MPIERIERPADRAELAAVLASTTGPVIPVGGDRWNGITGPLDFTASDDPVGPIGIDLSRLDRVIDFQPDDLTITVQAGLCVDALTRLLAEHGLCVPLTRGRLELTVGTVVSEARLSAHAAGYDGPRRHLLGLTVMDGLGIERRAGGRVVKNVAGYDLMKLHTGARETLGLLTELTLKLTPIPEVRQSLSGRLPGAVAIDAMTRRLVHSDIRPSAWFVTVSDGISFRLELDGFEEDVASETDQALAILVQVGGELTARSKVGCREAGVGLFEALSSPDPDSFELIVPSVVIDPTITVGGPSTDAGNPVPSRRRFDPLLCRGSIEFDLDADGAPDAAAIRAWRTHLAAVGTGLRLRSSRGQDDAPPSRTLDHDTLDGPAPAPLSLMNGIKQALDPGRRFSPGLFFWGL